MITHISPAGSMDLLSQLEVERLKNTASSELYQLYRNCTLAVLNSGSHTDNSKELLDKHQSFDVNVVRRERGIKLELTNPPEHAFVDGEIRRHGLGGGDDGEGDVGVGGAGGNAGSGCEQVTRSGALAALGQ